MTHCGPSHSSTSLRDVGRKEIQMGSDEIFRFIQSQYNCNKILFHVHGHSHNCWGMSQVGKIPVINPGALKDGRFAIAELVCLDGKWKFQPVAFHLLPHLRSKL